MFQKSKSAWTNIQWLKALPPSWEGRAVRIHPWQALQRELWVPQQPESAGQRNWVHKEGILTLPLSFTLPALQSKESSARPVGNVPKELCGREGAGSAGALLSSGICLLTYTSVSQCGMDTLSLHSTTWAQTWEGNSHSHSSIFTKKLENSAKHQQA